MNLVKCDKENCHNITTNIHSEYGSYCFAHIAFTHKPRILDRKQREYPLLTPSIMVYQSDVKFISIKSKRSVIKSMVRKVPLPKIFQGKTAETEYKPLECAYCDELGPEKYRLRCSHYICSECLTLIRTSLCPICQESIEGTLVSDEILSDIIEREYEDIR
jgi:hypothetical protein